MRIIFAILFGVAFFSNAQDTAQNLFSQYRSALYQIQIIELESGKKSSIGSGFQVSEDGKLVTNYHVVSSYIYDPDKYRIEYLDANGNHGELTLFGFDAINDLAVVSKDTQDSSISFALADSLPVQGMPIYSLGNPHDLGMIVVPGTFNGLKKNSFYQRIHFTGSINPGMSGGPAVNQSGEVIGVNVATAGNQIGFLIPLKQITHLIDNFDSPLAKDQYKSTIHQQLLENQSKLVNRLTENQWSTSQLGKAQVPDKIVDFISCWGGSNSKDKKALYLSVENRCRLDEQVYINNRFRTGALEMEFEWLTSQELSSHRFYNFYTKSISGAGPGNAASKEDVTNYQCQDNLVRNIHDVNSKSILCLRAYKDFAGLFDVLYIGASIDHKQQGLISHFTLAGVDEASAKQFTQHFMDAIEWQ